ncbi:dihydroxyacetone kinase subunit L [Rhizobium sophorae]|uniref:Dihydroxyacetone kinase subunit L n=1 Tax=Rhizobium sophorae TaxID=1535242 RepID=A0A7Y3S561_9HYPH|nr:dihydroxyacetone kinase subunit DhaL [Rhizobium sophorae]NKL38716.1 dihydroxyacetone kinase subunit L [Rhizobium leguminosarum bv. viciae]NNU37264.1 dihydroxyacetone kinase subunit L [Rhizobium sophorae]
MAETDARKLNRMFNRLSSLIAAEKDYLTELDGAIGDADHGITMLLGFGAVASELARSDLDDMTPSAVMTIAASVFLNAVGASTGPLYATAFLRAAKALECRPSLDAAGQVAMLQAITLGIQERGKGQRGDKTMLDTWIPAAEAGSIALAREVRPPEFWHEVVAAGEAGAAATRSMVAVRGRAARLGERSLGHVDPGAASAVLVLKAMREVFGDLS